jgi:hypothetical protein
VDSLDTGPKQCVALERTLSSALEVAFRNRPDLMRP